MTAPPGIVWLASFPKSGNTWFRIFLANLAAGDKGPADINDLDERGGIASSRHDFERATYLDSSLMSHDDIDELRPQIQEAIARDAKAQNWVKVHDGYTRLADGTPLLGRSAQCAVYLVRDPRDVAVSLSHHNSSSIDDAITLMNDPDSAFCKSRKGFAPQLRQKLLGWSGHAASWLDQADVPVLMLRYEDMRADPQKHFAAALAFANRPATDEEITRAISYADFDELKRQEGEKGFAERMGKQAPFFRSGRAGGWRDVLSPDQAARIEAAHRPMMDRLGY